MTDSTSPATSRRIAALAVPDGVVPTDGADYGAPGFVRLNLATTTSEAAEVVRRVVALVPPAGATPGE